MDTLIRFGTGNLVYTFNPYHQVSLSDNFRDVVPRTTRLPGVDGGFDEFGFGPAPREIGNVRVTFWIHADNEIEMKAALWEIGGLSSWGTQPLFMQPMDHTTPLFCYAKVNAEPYNQRAGTRPHKRISININFQVNAPGWIGPGTTGGLWDNGGLWDDGGTWDGIDTSVAVSGVSNNLSITPGGNVIIQPIITFSCGIGESVTNLTIQRLDGLGNVVDQISYNSALIAGDELVVDAAAKSVKLNGIEAYGAVFSAISSAWFSLVGGIANTVRVLMGGLDAGTIKVDYQEIYV